MGLFRSLIVIMVSAFTLAIINDDKKLNKVPLVGKNLSKYLKNNKHLVIIFIIAILELVI